MKTPGVEVLSLLAYRMEAIAIGHMALQHHMSWDKAPSMVVYFGGKQVIEGQATGFTNAAIEAAIIHCRAVLEFLGLQADKASNSQISGRTQRNKADDIGVEQFSGLSMLTREKAISAYPGPTMDAEAALALIFNLANKGLAHTTESFNRHGADGRLLEIAFRGVPILLVNGLYVPLGIEPPAYELKWRRRAV